MNDYGLLCLRALKCGGIQVDGKAAADKKFIRHWWKLITGLHGANRLASNSLLEAVGVCDHAATCDNAFEDHKLAAEAIPDWKRKERRTRKKWY